MCRERMVCRATHHTTPHHTAPQHATQQRTAPHRATPCHANVVPIYSLLALVPAHPHGVRSSGSVLIGGWQSGQADRFSLSLPQPPSVFLAPRHPAPPRSPSLLPSPASFLPVLHPFSLSSSPLKHTFHASLIPPLSFSFCISSLTTPPSTPEETRVFVVTLVVHVDLPRTHTHTHTRAYTHFLPPRGEIFMPMYRFTVIEPRNPRVRSVFRPV